MWWGQCSTESPSRERASRWRLALFHFHIQDLLVECHKPLRDIASRGGASTKTAVIVGYALGVHGLIGLTGSSLLDNTHAVPPIISPAPIPIATGELKTPSAAPGTAPATLFFLFLLSVCDSSRVVC